MRIDSASRRSRSALSASRACSRTTWPGWTSAATATWPVCGIGADEPAHEEVALQVVRLVRVDDDPDQQPALDEPQILGRQLLDRLAQLLQRRLARQLADHVALAGGDRQLGPDRRRALRDHRQHLDAVQPHADRAVVDDLVAEEQDRSRRRRVRPDASPPSSGSIGVDSLRNRSTASVGKVTGSASRIAPPAPARSGHPGQRAGALLELLDRGVERRRACPSPRFAAHTDTADPASISRPCADHAARAAADQLLRREHLVDRLEHRLGRREQRRRTRTRPPRSHAAPPSSRPPPTPPRAPRRAGRARSTGRCRCGRTWNRRRYCAACHRAALNNSSRTHAAHPRHHSHRRTRHRLFTRDHPHTAARRRPYWLADAA